MKNNQPNAIAFKTKGVTFYVILAVCVAYAVNNVKDFLNSFVTSNDSPPATYTTANGLLKATTPNGYGKVSNLSTLIAYCTQWITNPNANLTIRLLTGKSRINLEAVYNEFAKQFSGASLLQTFWNYMQFVFSAHTEALTKSLVLDYVNSVKPREMKNGVIMLTITGKKEVTAYELLAIETLLLQKYRGTNRPLIITFEVPGLLGLTSFFNNTEATKTFTKEVVAGYNDVEKQYENPSEWNETGAVVHTANTNVPEKDRAEVLNGIIDAALGKTGQFQMKEITADIAENATTA